MTEMTIAHLHDHLLTVVSGSRFLKMQGIGNEVPFFICPYIPALHVEVERVRRQLVRQLEHKGITVLDVNLYDASVRILKDRKVWDKIVSQEVQLGKDALEDLLKNVLDPERHLVPHIASLIANSNGFDVLFLSGVGEVYPYVRSHTILNNLQSTAKKQPTLMFFPGEYTHSSNTGASLSLFGKMHDDKYYRAFNILNYTA